MTAIGGLFILALIGYSMYKIEEQFKKNIITLEVRIDFLENRIRDLEHFDEEKDKKIQDLERKTRELDKRLFEFEQPYRQ